MKRAILVVGGALLLGGGAYLAGAFERSEYYAIVPSDAEARLAALNFGSEAPDGMRLVLRSRGPALLRWDLLIDGKRIADVRAYLSGADPGTRVRTDLAFAKGDAMMGLEEDPFLNEVAEIAMDEKIDSTLDDRTFNRKLVTAKMALAAAANPEGFANTQSTMKQNLSEEMVKAEDPGYSSMYQAIPGRRSTGGKPLPPNDFKKTHADGGWGKN